MSIRSKNKKVILIFGPTAVGKTQLLLDLFPGSGEIISADSMQVYRGMDIGTAKPSGREKDELRHHLIDIRNPHEQFHTGDFVELADQAVLDILAKGLIPVIAGGTAFYFKNFIYGLPQAPPSDSKIREKLLREFSAKGLLPLYEELKICDPVSANRIHSNDSYRIMRALEVIRSSGKALSSFKINDKQSRPDYDFLVLGLNRDREELYQRINLRVEEMFKLGLPDEFRRLKKAGYDFSDPGMKAIGYQEFFSAEASGCLVEYNILKMVQQNTRRYAKRQLTFFSSLFPDSGENQKSGLPVICLMNMTGISQREILNKVRRRIDSFLAS